METTNAPIRELSNTVGIAASCELIVDAAKPWITANPTLTGNFDRKEIVNLEVGSKVIYPNQGLCLIDSIVQKEVGGNAISFYQLALLDDSGGQLFVPVEKAGAGRLRQLLSISEVPHLLALCTQPIGVVKDWKQRASENAKRLASGSPYDLTEVIKSLTELRARKELSLPESRLLDKARHLLISELAEVLQESRCATEARLDQALAARHAGSAAIA